jgi:hypothetical protein
LVLLDTLPHWSYKSDYDEYSELFIHMQKDNTRGTEIFTQKYSYERDVSENIYTSILDPNINVYKYDFGNNQYVLSNTISSLPLDAIVIKKIDELGIKDPKKELEIKSKKNMVPHR